MTWSPENVDMGIQSLLFQIYPILLSTLLSVNRQELSTPDVHFALLLSSSPLAVYLVVASIGDLVGIKTSLYKQIESHRLIICALGAMVLPLWIGLSITTWVSRKAFKDSFCMGDNSITSWLSNLMAPLFGFAVCPGILCFFVDAYSPLLVYPPILFFLVKCRGQVVMGIRAYWKEVPKPWGWLLTPWAFAKCAWYAPIVVIL